MSVQVVFRERVRCDDLLNGWHLSRAFSPHPLMKFALRIGQAILPQGNFDLTCAQPHYWQLQCTSMRVSVLPASATQADKDAHLHEPREDTQIWLGTPRTPAARIAHLNAHAADYYYEPGLVYTFSYWGDICDMVHFRSTPRVGPMSLGTFDMSTFLNRIPMIEQAVRRSDRAQIAWSFELLNERLLLPAAAAAAAPSAPSAAPSAASSAAPSAASSAAPSAAPPTAPQTSSACRAQSDAAERETLKAAMRRAAAAQRAAARREAATRAGAGAEVAPIARPPWNRDLESGLYL